MGSEMCIRDRDELRKLPVRSIDEVLTGKVPGGYANLPSRPGQNNSAFTLRGGTSGSGRPLGDVKIYIDGKIAGSTSHEGKLAYPEWAYYAIGVYKDADENYPMEGRLFSASVFDGALSEDQIRARSGLGPAPKPVDYTVRPMLKFTGTDTARIEWGTKFLAGGSVAFGEGKELDRVSPAKLISGSHVVELKGLRHATGYSYRIVQKFPGGQMLSPVYEFNTSLNFSVLHEPSKAVSYTHLTLPTKA